MKKIGMVGGLAWPSTADYYRLLCSRANAHFRDCGYPAPYPTVPLVLESLNIQETRAAQGVNGDDASWVAYETIFRETFARLAQAGAEVGMIASNTPHMRMHRLRHELAVPLISILDTTAAAVLAAGGRRALVLGTPVTMRSRVYAEVLEGHGIETLARPDDGWIEEMGHLIDVELYQGRVEEPRSRILALCHEHVASAADAVVCLACTELPLAFPEYRDAAHFEADGIRFVNTTVAHAQAVLDAALR